MHFLDELPLDFTRPETIELRDLLLRAYGDPEETKALVRQVHLVAGTFPLSSNMRLLWTELMQTLSDQSQLRKLVEVASSDPATAAYNDRFKEMLSLNPSLRTSGGSVSALSWRGDDQAPAEATRLYYERLQDKRSRLLPIAVARHITELAGSVAKLELVFSDGTRAYGTGFLIQPNLLLTSYHNLVDAERGKVTSVVAEFDYEEDYIGVPLAVSGLIETIGGDTRHDWGTIRLARPVDRQPISLGSPYDVHVDDLLIIIQHPLGAQKKFGLEGRAVRFVDGEVVQYVTDTQKGSSGSPVFNSRMHVIALHQAEAEHVRTVNGREETYWRNQGVRITQVQAALRTAGIAFAES